MDDLAEDYYPIDQTFSRKELHDRIGLSDDVLAFWIKQELIIPLPARPRAHRRFSFEQLHIAAILNALRSLGANVGTLRCFARFFQIGVKMHRSANLDAESLYAAATLCRQLHLFAEGGHLTVHDLSVPHEEKKKAETEQEVIESWLSSHRLEGASQQVARFAQSLSKEEGRALEWTTTLLSEQHLTHGGTKWVLWLDSLGDPKLASTDEILLDEEEGPLAAFYVPVSRLIAGLWPERIEAAEVLYERKRTEYLKEYAAKLEEIDPEAATKWRARATQNANESTENSAAEEGSKVKS